MASKPKTLPVIRVNPGDAKALASKLYPFFKKHRDEYIRAALAAVQKYAVAVDAKMAADAAGVECPTPCLNELIEREFPESWQAGCMESLSSNGLAMDLKINSLPYAIRNAIASAAARYRIKTTKQQARKISYWFCRKTLWRVSKQQRKLLEAAGIDASWLKKKWRIPVVKAPYMSPDAIKAMPGQVAEAVKLITRLTDSERIRIQKILMQHIGTRNAYDIDALAAKLARVPGITPERALRIAQNQLGRVNTQIQVANAKAVGIKEAMWVWYPGRISFRPYHRYNLDRKLFDLKKGLYDPEAGAHIFPGDLPYCRCQTAMLIPDFLSTGGKK